MNLAKLKVKLNRAIDGALIEAGKNAGTANLAECEWHSIKHATARTLKRACVTNDDAWLLASYIADSVVYGRDSHLLNKRTKRICNRQGKQLITREAVYFGRAKSANDTHWVQVLPNWIVKFKLKQVDNDWRMQVKESAYNLYMVYWDKYGREPALSLNKVRVLDENMQEMLKAKTSS